MPRRRLEILKGSTRINSTQISLLKKDFPKTPTLQIDLIMQNGKFAFCYSQKIFNLIKCLLASNDDSTRCAHGTSLSSSTRTASLDSAGMSKHHSGISILDVRSNAPCTSKHSKIFSNNRSSLGEMHTVNTNRVHFSFEQYKKSNNYSLIPTVHRKVQDGQFYCINYSNMT